MGIIEKGYKGISFPFRFNSSGGVTTSTTSPEDLSHIEESVEQIIRTKMYERIMELDFYCDVDPSLFENMEDATNQGLLAFNIREALNKNDDRIDVEDVKFELDEEGSIVNALVTVFVEKYLITDVLKVPINK